MFTGLTEQLDFGNYLISEILPENHELVNLKKILKWEEMNEIYSECYETNKGNSTKSTNLVLGLIILKHLFQKPYRVIIEELHVNISYMHFCSVSYEDITKSKLKNKKLIDHSSLIKIKKRLGSERFTRIEKIFLKQLLDHKLIAGKCLLSDTTSLEKNIIYPTEIGLLKRVIEEAEVISQKIRYKKELIKTAIIKKANSIAKVYYSNSRKTKKLLETCSKELIKIAHKAVLKAEKTFNKIKNAETVIENRYEKLKEIGSKIIEQTERKLLGEKVSDKIVSYYEDHARALPKGKVGKPIEFGDKLRVDMSGNGYITDYELYTGNPGDITMLEDAISNHGKIFKEEFQWAAFDRNFYNEEIILELEEKYKIVLAIPHKNNRLKKLGPRKKKLYNKRSAIEAKISEGKRKCGLNKSLYKGFEGDQIWTSLSIFVLNIRKLMREISLKPKLIKRFA
jgi:transposase, IS5 family